MLTRKQRNFCIRLKGNIPVIDAYRDSYACAGLSDKVLKTRADKVLASPQVRSYLDGLKKRAATDVPDLKERGQQTMTPGAASVDSNSSNLVAGTAGNPPGVMDLIDELETARCQAMEAGQTSAAISAIMGKAKLLGLGSENVDIKTPKIELVRFVD